MSRFYAWDSRLVCAGSASAGSKSAFPAILRSSDLPDAERRPENIAKVPIDDVVAEKDAVCSLHSQSYRHEEVLFPFFQMDGA